VDVGRRGLARVGTGASSEEGAASTKEVPAGEGSGEVRLGGRATNEFNGLGFGRFGRGRETRAVPSWGSRYSRGSSWTLRGGLREARIGGIRNILVPGRTESGEGFAADRIGAIEEGLLTTTVDTEKGEGVGASYDRLLNASFRTTLVSPSVGRTVMEQSTDRAGLCVFFV